MIRQPMLAAKCTDLDLQRLNYPVLASPKIDGIRGVVCDGRLLSRSMKPIRNTSTQIQFGHRDYNGLDGELVVGEPTDKDLMQNTSSGVMSIHGNPQARFYVFDLWNSPFQYVNRLMLLERMVKGLDNPNIIFLDHYLIEDYQELQIYEEQMLAEGYEGIMIRSRYGDYKDGRSTIREGGLLKVKRFTDGEAIITGFEPLMRNCNELESDERGYAKRSHSSAGKIEDDMLGALHVTGVSTAISFNIGSGFTESQRRDLWNRRASLVGKIVKYKHFAVTGVKDKPRIPIFLGFRDREDM